MQDVHDQELYPGDVFLVAFRMQEGGLYLPLHGRGLKIDITKQTVINPDSCVLTYPQCTDPIIGNKGD